MSNEETKTPISKATNVAEDIVKLEFIIVSTEEKVDSGNNDNDHVVAPNEIAGVSPITKKKTTDKKISKSTKPNEDTDGSQHAAALATNLSSKVQNKKKGGPSAKMLSLIQERQKTRIEAEIRAEEEAKEKQRIQKAYEEQEEERLRLEKEHREKKKEKEKKRIQRKKQEGSYLTKDQRDKRQRAQVQFEAAGIQVPSHIISQSAICNNGESSRKRVLYDDHRKTNTTPSNASVQLVMTSIESENKASGEESDSSTDDWTQNSEEETIYNEKLQIQKITEAEVNTHLITNQGSSDSEEDENDQSLSSMERVRRRLEQHREICESHRSSEILRAPVICVLGHVNAGKTSILDNLRRTHVQTDEAGGITQQIGATNVPLETILERTKMCRKMISRQGDFILPGLLIIDTPGHETFKNLRSRGSSLCDLAILVVDIMDGLEQQTIESIQLLTERRTPFIIALNKIDLLYGWKGDKQRNVELVLQEQNSFTQNQFEKRCNDIIVQFAEQGLNVALYYKNPDPNEFYSMVPTSARSGDGMGSLIAMIIETSQTSLAKRISYTDELQATVMEVKAINGLGTTIDVTLVNGCLSVGDKIVLAGQEGSFVTQIRGLLIPESNQELRVTNQYKHNTKVKGARGIKIVAKDLEKSMAGLPLFVARKQDEIDYFKAEMEQILKTALNSITLKDSGVYVHASTLGSLEAFLELLKTRRIPYSGINIGPVHRKDVIRASAQLEKDIEWATILAFDVKIERDAQEYAKTIGVKIIQNDEIYRLCDMFVSHQQQMKEENKEKHRHLAVFPCKLKILPNCVFNSRDPIVCGVRVEDGFIKLGTPICVPSKDCIELGRIASIEFNHKSLDIARKGAEVCIKIVPATGETPKMYGRHFDEDDILMSKISRESIDVIKAYFREDMQSNWQLMIELKKIFNIV